MQGMLINSESIYLIILCIVWYEVIILNEIEHLLLDISELKSKLESLILLKDCSLLDEEVLKASNNLNDMLNQYNRLLKDKLD